MSSRRRAPRTPVAADSDQRQRRANVPAGPDPAPDCRYVPLFGGPRRGPSLYSPSYQLVANGAEQIARARWQVTTWAEQVHAVAVRRAAALAAAASGPVDLVEVSS